MNTTPHCLCSTMAPASETAHGTPGPSAAAPAQSGGAAAGKLQAGSGAAMAAAAAQQAKVRRKQQELQDLLQAALAKPAERSKQQVRRDELWLQSRRQHSA